jgi:hypothetical protein
MIQRTCTVTLGRELLAVAAVSLRGGRTDVAGFQFINTAGWFNMWKAHAPTAGVPASLRPSVAKQMRRIAAACEARWSP